MLVTSAGVMEPLPGIVSTMAAVTGGGETVRSVERAGSDYCTSYMITMSGGNLGRV